jgi:ABC-type sugar transport system ATPase subunit
LLARKPGLAKHPDRLILAGLRPEAFSPELIPAYPAIVETIESLGHERLVYFRPVATTPNADQRTLVAHLPGPQVEAAGQSIKLGFDPEQMHFFTEVGAVIA